MEPTVKKTNRFSPFIFAAALIALLAGCSSTRVVDSWKDPSFDPSQFQKTLVVFQHPDPGVRRMVEEEMARDIPHAVPAYEVLSDGEIRDIDRVKQKVRQLGFDSAVVMRLVGVDKQVTYEPAHPIGAPPYPYYMYDFWPAWAWGWTTVWEPGYVRTDQIVKIATYVYDLRQDKLVWTSDSETFNPASLRTAVAEVVKVTARKAGEALRARG
jgi:hypothetical protein